jgi:hypothetical protein
MGPGITVIPGRRSAVRRKSLPGGLSHRFRVPPETAYLSSHCGTGRLRSFKKAGLNSFD